MPGIVGLITRMPPKYAESLLRQMIETLCHETFYVSGMWIEEQLGVYVGWVSQKGSFSECMPLWNEGGDVSLVLSGEEYPEPDTIHRLKEKGHLVDGKGPSYLVHVYEEDSNFPAGLNGRFHALLADRTRGTATLFNDRWGMHRLYWHESKEAFYFSGEAKAILKVCPEFRSVDHQSLGEFLGCGCVLENRTLFKGISVLPPASVWVFQGGALHRRGGYFQPADWECQETLNPDRYYQELKEVFTRNLPRYFQGDQRVGMSLTGGLDTRMIMAWQKTPRGSLPCYSFGGTYRDCQDILLARRVAHACGQSHQVIEIGREFLERFPYYAERAVYLTDGCAGVVHAPDLFLNGRAREIAPVRMTGNYGGEVLRRVRAFKPLVPLPGLLCGEIMGFVREAKDTYDRIVKSHPLSFAVFRQAPWHHFGLLALEQTQLSVRSPFLDNDLVRTVFRAPESACASHDVSLGLVADGNPALFRIRTDRGLAGDQSVPISKVSQHILSFTAKAEYAYGDGMPQWLAQIDHLMGPFSFDRIFLGRHKFTNFRVWYRDVFAQYVREMLLDSRTLSRGYFQRPAMETVVRRHLKGDRNYTAEINQLLSLELVHRLLLEVR